MRSINAILESLLLNSALFGQEQRALECLYSTSDEILLVRVTGERPKSESYMTCKCLVNAEIFEQFKIERLSRDTIAVTFHAIC